MIARDAMRPWIQHRLAVHEKAVVMMAVVERQMDLPRAIRLADHRVGRGMPVVEITGDENFLCLGRAADKIHRFGHVLGGITVPGNGKRDVLTMHYDSWRSQNGIHYVATRLGGIKEAQPHPVRNSNSLLALI
jgi:hypothetical protein